MASKLNRGMAKFIDAEVMAGRGSMNFIQRRAYSALPVAGVLMIVKLGLRFIQYIFKDNTELVAAVEKILGFLNEFTLTVDAPETLENLERIRLEVEL